MCGLRLAKLPLNSCIYMYMYMYVQVNEDAEGRSMHGQTNKAYSTPKICTVANRETHVTYCDDGYLGNLQCTCQPVFALSEQLFLPLSQAVAESSLQLTCADIVLHQTNVSGNIILAQLLW